MKPQNNDFLALAITNSEWGRYLTGCSKRAIKRLIPVIVEKLRAHLEDR